MKLTADMIEAFAGVYLSQRYDTPQPTPDFHRECWKRYVSDYPSCATAAPRNHAKSTALTHDFILANVCFRVEEYIILVGSTEELAIEHLGDIANELRENEDLIRDFKIKGFLTDAKTDIIVECEDGHQFRIIARGAEQKIRGRKWRGKRPGLIVGDDLEDDEQVENKDRRKKFSKWFFRACKQALRDGGRIRVHGTILHRDSLLNHLIKNPLWDSVLYKAHDSSTSFTNILWEEKFPEARLRLIKAEFVAEGDAAGYAQEYLNDPQDSDEAYLKKEYFLEMRDEDYHSFKTFAVGVDFAISKQDSANRTSFTTVGRDVQNYLNFVDQLVGRMDSAQIIDGFFDVNERWKPEAFYVEGGQIWLAISTTLFEEMRIRNVYFEVIVLQPIKDKAARGRPFQKRMKRGHCRFDKRASWYIEYEDELLLFTGISEATLDDQFDSTATVVKGLTEVPPPEKEDQMTEEEIAFEKEALRLMKQQSTGRSAVTGY